MRRASPTRRGGEQGLHRRGDHAALDAAADRAGAEEAPQQAAGESVEEARQYPALSRWTIAAGIGRVSVAGLMLLGLLALPFVGVRPLLIANILCACRPRSSIGVSVVAAPSRGVIRLFGTFRRAEQPAAFWIAYGWEALILPVALAGAVVLFQSPSNDSDLNESRHMTTDPIVILSYARTPMGSFQGSLSGATAVDLGATAVKAAVARAGVDPADVERCYMGCVLPAGLGQAPARQAARFAGLGRPCRGGDGQQDVRFGHDGGDDGRRCDRGGLRRHRRRRRHGEHDQRAIPDEEAPRRRADRGTTRSMTI